MAAEPTIAVSPVSTEMGDAMRVRASIRIDAPPAAVWAVLSDCARAARIVPYLKSCRIVARDSAGKWDVREHVINPPLLPTIRTTVRNDFDAPRRMSFRLISGDVRASDGTWTLKAEGARTLLSYDALVAPSFPVPQFLVSHSLKNDVPQMLQAIDRLSRETAR